MKSLDKLNTLLEQVPENIRDDVEGRVRDWVSSGGSVEHPYIEQQIRFLESYIEASKKRNV